MVNREMCNVCWEYLVFNIPNEALTIYFQSPSFNLVISLGDVCPSHR